MAIFSGRFSLLDPYGLLARAELPSQVKVDLIELFWRQGASVWSQDKCWTCKVKAKAISLEDLKTIQPRLENF